MRIFPTPDDDLAQLELFEPELGRELSQSAHIRALRQGQILLTAWDVSTLNYFSGPENVRAFETLVGAMQFPAKLNSALLRSVSQVSGAWWTTPASFYERVDRIHVASGELELHYATRHGGYHLHLAATPLTAEEHTAVNHWLQTGTEVPLRNVALGRPWRWETLEALRLLPRWETLAITGDSRNAEVIELGARFLCRALVLYPEFMLMWRGVEGKTLIQNFAQQRLAQRQRDLQAVLEMLPAAAPAFWAAPVLPEAPDETSLAPGFSAHLPTPTLWPKPEDNQTFMTALAKMYKTVGRKVAKLIPQD